MAFWKPGTVAPGDNRPRTVLVDRETERDDFVAPSKTSSLPIAQQRQQLPIAAHRLQVLHLIKQYNVVIIVGSTGCGKTTQIPQYLHESGWTSGGRLVVCTQPRRVAAVSVATRVAEEMGVPVGTDVGYTIRFDDQSDSSRTRIKYLTDGMLVREMMMDPLLQRYSVIMLDEAHERTVATDLLVGLLKKILKKRPDLRLVVSSATVDALAFKEYFETNKFTDRSRDKVAIMSVEGRCYPVELHYTPTPVSDYLISAVETVVQIHRSEPLGDVLVFLTGQEEIDAFVNLVNEQVHKQNIGKNVALTVMPMYSGLPLERQQKVFEPTPRRTRKVVAATNIAEASITIEGIVYVVDCMFVKQRFFNPDTGFESLVVVPISKASATQRAGRAGRVRAGKCYRLMTAESFESELQDSTAPEMMRCNFAPVVLQLKALGVDDVLHFDYMTPPPAPTLARALELLYSLEAIGDDCRLTRPLGHQLSELPLDPMLGKMLLSSGKFGCSEEILTIAAMLCAPFVFVQHRGRESTSAARIRYSVTEGDHLTLLNVHRVFEKQAKKKRSEWCQNHSVNFRAILRATEIRKQLRRYAQVCGVELVSCGRDTVPIRRCIVAGFFSNAARRMPNGTYCTVRDNQEVAIHPYSVLSKHSPEWFVFHEVVQTTQFFVRDVTVIEPTWLTELAPHFYEVQAKHTDGPRNVLDLDDAPPSKSRRLESFL